MLDGLLKVAELLRSSEQKLEAIDKQIVVAGRNNATCRHLITAPGFGPIVSSALAAFVTNPAGISPPRSAWCHIKVKLGAISKRRNGYPRRLLVNGAMTVLNGKQARQDPWLVRLLASKPRKLVAVALANKMARIAWALMMRQEDGSAEAEGSRG